MTVDFQEDSNPQNSNHGSEKTLNHPKALSSVSSIHEGLNKALELLSNKSIEDLNETDAPTPKNFQQDSNPGSEKTFNYYKTLSSAGSINEGLNMALELLNNKSIEDPSETDLPPPVKIYGNPNKLLSVGNIQEGLNKILEELNRKTLLAAKNDAAKETVVSPGKAELQGFKNTSCGTGFRSNSFAR